eukprot:TRINITY_DN3362_c0_g1_i1.p1 TRINITY_DN3362_c0_g1~~TRINITY_DN3362_c0_g1_i1.p1  ORF type:complete len:403 (+),score=83.47 TRINITY_DN3362_c0_g1_i1:568-1776(+)
MLDDLFDLAMKRSLHGAQALKPQCSDALRSSLNFLALINCDCIQASTIVDFVNGTKLIGLSLGGSIVQFDPQVQNMEDLKNTLFAISSIQFLDITFIQNDDKAILKNLWEDDARIFDLSVCPRRAVEFRNQLITPANREIVRDSFASCTYAKGKWGNPLHFLTRAEDLSGVEDLINLGCDVNAVDNSCNTALLLASNLGNVQIIRTLLTSGAADSIWRKNRKMDTPVYVSCLKGFAEIVELILKHTPQDKLQILYNPRMYHNGWSPGIVACISQSVQVLQVLKSHGFDLNQPNAYGGTPLHVCCQKNFLEGATLLLEAKVDINPVDSNHFTPLDYAFRHEASQELVDLLKSFGAKCGTDLPGRYGHKGSRGRGRGRGGSGRESHQHHGSRAKRGGGGRRGKS